LELSRKNLLGKAGGEEYCASVMMSRPLAKLSRRMRVRSGQSLLEYAVILALIAMICVVVLRGVGLTTANSMEPANAALAE